MRYKDVNSSLSAHINSLRVVIGVLILINFYMWYGWQGASSDLRIHIPPDIRSGAVVKADEISDANIYAFAAYIFQQLNHWNENGEADYGKKIYSMSAYLTPQFREFLIKDMNERSKNGELMGRIRFIQPIPGQGFEERRVDIQDESHWIVWLDFNIHEYVQGMEVKSVNIRYPVKVSRFNIDPETNPWGLALNGFSGTGPVRLNADNRPETKKGER